MIDFFFAKRLFSTRKHDKQVSKPAVLIAMIGIAVGLAVMIISVAVVIGFKSQVKNKIVGFGSHIQIFNFDAVKSYETHPIFVDSLFRSNLKKDKQVKHVQRYITKPGMIKTNDAFQGIILKGVAQDFDPSFLKSYLLEGNMPKFSDSKSTKEVLISKTIAQKLKLNLGDRIYVYFIKDNVRVRRLTIKGIYQTNFVSFDEAFLLTDLYTVRKLNKWHKDQVSGVELTVKDYSKLYETTDRLAKKYTNTVDQYGGSYFVQNIEELQQQIFSWLSLLDMNVWVILILMIGVSGFTIISGLLIIILERTQMIGLLKALGADNGLIRRIFLWLSFFLIGKGMLWGNAVALLFCFLQNKFHILKLDATDYYLSSVPISMNWGIFLLINIGTLLIAMLMLLGPSYLITKIKPAQSMRYE